MHPRPSENGASMTDGWAEINADYRAMVREVLIADGRPIKVIAREMGASPSAVTKWKGGVTTPRGRHLFFFAQHAQKLRASAPSKPVKEAEGKAMKIQIKNWAKFQHYKDRSPPWIKLHRGLLDDYGWHCLQDASKALAPCIWLIASESDAGVIEASAEALAFRLRVTPAKLAACLKDLESKGFITTQEVDASALLADCSQGACLETETEGEVETETEGEGEGEKEAEAEARVSRSPDPGRGSRLPDDWRPSSENVAFAVARGFTPGAVREIAESFSAYWRSTAGAKARKANWDLTWQTWVRREADRHRPAAPAVVRTTHF